MVKRSQDRVTASSEDITEFPTIVPRSLSEYRDQYRLETLIPDQICVIEHLFTPTNCHAFLKHFNSSITPLLSKPAAPRKGEATRTNERYAILEPAFAETLFRDTGLSQICKSLQIDREGSRRLTGLNSNIRIYRYQPGAFFGPHYDESVTDKVTKAKSVWTLLIYLTEGNLVGGETSFEASAGYTIAPKVENGMALLHRHGKDCLLHEGKPVVSGIKWLLRSDLMFA